MELSQTDMASVESLDSFMDVVMSYKCKLCDFTSSHPQDIASHVKSKHIPVQVSAASDSAIFKQRVQFAQKASDVQTLILPSVDAADVTEHMSTQTDIPIVDCLTTEEDTKAQDVYALQIPAGKLGPARLPLSQPSCVTGDIEASQAASHIDVDPGGASVVTEPSLGASVPSTGMSRELFLCGQCSMGYSNVEECKIHMLQAHNGVLPTAEMPPAPPPPPPPPPSLPVPEPLPPVVTEKVSVGTQVNHGKKPGRKPKGYQAPAPPESSEEEDCAVIIGGTRSRPRRIKTPKALKNGFLLERPKGKTRDSGPLVGYTFKCQETGCYARFKTSECLDLHLKCHRRGDGEYGFQCCECMVIFTKWKELRFHFWRSHKIDTDLLTCEECSFKTDTLHKLKTHKEVHGEERPYKCSICEKGFKQLAQMHNHKSVHLVSTDEEKWYCNKTCNICKRSFTNQKCLAKHVQAVHCKVKPFVCSLCGYSASRKAMIQLHMRTHTGEKPFKCDLCSYVTGDHNSLRRHRMRHTGHKPYRCQYCPYACIQAISLKCHMKNKHPGLAGVFFCELCQYRTVSKQNFTNHQKDHQNGLIPVTRTAGSQVSTGVVESGGEQVLTIDGVGVPVEGQPVEVHGTEAQISAEDLAKLTANYEGLVPSDVSAAQLIYSALNAMSQNVPPTSTQQSTHILEGVQTTISAGAEEDGVTTHTITFHLATPEDPGAVVGAEVEQSGPVLLAPSIPVHLLQTGGDCTQVATVSLPYCTDTGEVSTITVSEQNVVTSAISAPE